MKYYVLADVHGFYTAMMEALDRAGYNEDKGPKKILMCGDLFDRGDEALKMQDFVSEHMKNDDIILIRGNHEDLMMELLEDWEDGSYMERHHNSNGTVDTVLQLTHTKSWYDLLSDIDGV